MTSKLSAILCVLSVPLFILLSGCARTVTIRPDVGSQMSIEITFRGDVDTVSNRYYMVFGGTSPVFMDKDRYFFAPGEDYLQEKLDTFTQEAEYYDNFFRTWGDFVKLRDNTYYICNGPFSSATSHISYVLSLLSYRTTSGEDPKKIKLVFYLSKLTAPLPEEIYFNFLAVDGSGRLRDKLGATDNRISVNKGTSVHNISEAADPSIGASLDIISWKVEIQ